MVTSTLPDGFPWDGMRRRECQTFHAPQARRRHGGIMGDWREPLQSSEFILAAAGGMHCTLLTKASKGLKPSERFAGSHHRKVRPIIRCNFTAPSRRRGERGAESKPPPSLGVPHNFKAKVQAAPFLTTKKRFKFRTSSPSSAAWVGR